MIQPYFIYEITSGCTNSCIYCYNVWKKDKDYPKGELSLSGIKNLFEKLLGEITPEGIALTGGEPLLHSCILEVVSFLNDKKIKVGIASNGILLDEVITQKLVNKGVDYFEISLISTKQKTYNSLTQDNQLKKVKKALLNVKKYRAKLTVSFVITKLNLVEIEDIIDFSFAFSTDSIALNRFVPGGNGLKHLSKLQITGEDLKNVLSIANKKSREYNLPINITIPIESCIIDHRKYPNLNFGICSGGRKKWVIDPIGNLRTCEQNTRILGNLFNSNFSELSRLEEVNLFQHSNLKTTCNKCEQFRYCGGGCRFLTGSNNSG